MVATATSTITADWAGWSADMANVHFADQPLQREPQTCVSGAQAIVLAGCLLDPTQLACQSMHPAQLYLFNLPLCPDNPIQPVPPCLDAESLYAREACKSVNLGDPVPPDTAALCYGLKVDPRFWFLLNSVGACEAGRRIRLPSRDDYDPRADAETDVEPWRGTLPGGGEAETDVEVDTDVDTDTYQYETDTTYEDKDEKEKDEKKNTAFIVGGIVAGVAVLGGAAYFLMRKKKR